MILTIVFDDEGDHVVNCLKTILDADDPDDMLYKKLELALDTNFFGIKHSSFVAWLGALYDQACSLQKLLIISKM